MIEVICNKTLRVPLIQGEHSQAPSRNNWEKVRPQVAVGNGRGTSGNSQRQAMYTENWTPGIQYCKTLRASNGLRWARSLAKTRRKYFHLNVALTHTAFSVSGDSYNSMSLATKFVDWKTPTCFHGKGRPEDSRARQRVLNEALACHRAHAKVDCTCYAFRPGISRGLALCFCVVRFLDDGLIFDSIKLPTAANVDQNVSEDVQRHLGTGDPQCNRDMVSDMVVQKRHTEYTVKDLS